MRRLLRLLIISCFCPKTPRGARLKYKMVKKLGAIASVDDIRPHHFRHDLGTTITRKRVAPLYSKELMGIKSDKVYCLGLLEYLSYHKITFGEVKYIKSCWELV